MRPRRAVFCLFACLLWTAALWGQSSSGTITGRVVDVSGSAIAGAQVRVINQVDKSGRSFTTDPGGNFVFTDLGPSAYTVQVTAKGFKQFEKSDLQLTASQNLSVGDLRLQVGQVSETVEVKAEGAVVETASGDRTALIDSREISDLMARGRDIMAMLQILPGVINDSTGNDVLGQFSTPTMDGGRDFYNAVNIDGISGNTARGRTAESPINLDAIAQVTVLANSFTAEYGTATSGVINLVTKSGTQNFHGGVYYYLRNEDLNANDFFANRQGLPRSRYRFNTTGGFLGGPIFIPKHFNTNKQKLFFFFSIEDDPNTVPNSVRNFTVPTALERQGNFSQSVTSKGAVITIKDPTTGNAFPGNIIPSTRIDANMSKLMGIFPLPNALNTAVTGFAYNFQISGSENEPVNQEILKLDYNISDKAKLWLRASGFSSNNTGLTSPAIDNQWGPVPVDYKQTMPNLGLSFTYVFGPTLVNEATLGMNLWTETQPVSGTALAAYQRANYGINIPQSYPTDNPLGLLPAVAFGSAITNGVAITYDGRFPLDDNSTNFSFSDGLSKVAGPHVFKAGFHWEHVLYNQYHQAGGNGFPGSFNFQTDASNPNDTGYAYANAILGNYDTYSEATNRVNYAPITRIFEWYVQDHWRVAPHFTLDLGVRFTDGLPESPNNNNAGNFDPATFVAAQAPVLYRPVLLNGSKVVVNPLTGAVVPNVYSGLIVPNTGNTLNGIITPTTPGFPRAMVYSNGILPAPRVGLAWDPSGNGKTAIRGGGGIYYTNRLDAGTLGNLFFNPPAIFNPTQYYGTVETAANGTGLLSPSSFSRDIDPHAKTVTAYHLDFGIQREIGFGTVADVAYVGNFGRHLGEVLQLNTVPFGAEFLPQNQNPQTNTPLSDNYFRPYPGYNGIPQQIYQGNSSYHSLQAQLHRRFAKNIQFGVVYTFSKAFDYGEGDSTSTSGAPPNASDTVATYLNRRVYNYGLAGYDRPNIFTFHFLYDVPKVSQWLPNPVVKLLLDNWQISDITTFESGAPQGVSLSETPAVNFVGGGDAVRTLMVGNPALPKSQRTFNQYFNTAAFAEPVPISPTLCNSAGCPPLQIANIGDAPQSPIRGPGVNNWNTSLYKNFVVHESFRVQFRAEAYNTFNHTQYSTVGSTIAFNAAGQNTNTQFGQVTATRNPRYMQLALRVVF